MSVNRISPEDLLALSAYLDGALDPPERYSLERRLATEPLLRAELESLHDTVNLVKSLPSLKAPRDFTLTPVMLAQMSGGSNVSHSPKIIRLVQFNRWQVASIATLAASILLVFIGLFAGSGDTASPNTDANEAFQLSEPSVAGEIVEDGIFKPTFTPEPDLGSVMRNETTAASSSAPPVPGVMGTPQPTGAAEVSVDEAEEPAPVPPSGETTGLLPDAETEDETDNESVVETQAAQSPVNPSAAIPQSGQAGAVANNPATETQNYAAPTATAQSSPAATFVSATKVAGNQRSDDTAAPSDEPDLEPAPETGRAEFDNSVDEDEGFEVNALLIIGLVGVIASVLALAYTWRRR